MSSPTLTQIIYPRRERPRKTAQSHQSTSLTQSSLSQPLISFLPATEPNNRPPPTQHHQDQYVLFPRSITFQLKHHPQPSQVMPQFNVSQNTYQPSRRHTTSPSLSARWPAVKMTSRMRMSMRRSALASTRLVLVLRVARCVFLSPRLPLI